MQASETYDDGVVDLNVGGTHYSTTRATLCSYPDSMLATMFGGRHELKKRADGRVFIDRDGTAFGHVLQFLRDGDLDVENLDRGLRDRLKREACYYCLAPLEDILAAVSEEPTSVFLRVCAGYKDTGRWYAAGKHPRDLAKDASSVVAGSVQDAVALLAGLYQRAGYRLISVSCSSDSPGAYHDLLFTKV